jgi:hypothetical protein
MKKYLLPLTLSLIASFQLGAQKYIGSEIRLLGRDGIELTTTSSSSEVTLNQPEPSILTASINHELIDSTWKMFAVTFTPTDSGKVLIELGATAGAPETQFVAYDSITVTGAELKNGGFDLFAKDKPTTPKWWWGDYQENQVYKDATQAHGGDTFALAQSGKLFETHMEVTVQQPVTIVYFAKRVAFAPVE